MIDSLRASPEWRFLGVLPRAAPGRTLAWWSLIAIRGALPAAFTIAVASAGDLADPTTILSRAYEGGTDLSGGQWQRVALARALCAVEGGAGVVVLDEPTAQLDVRGEAEIFDRVLQATRGCTTIHPLLSVLALFAIPAATSASWRAGAERVAQDRAAPHLRLARHLFDVGTAAGPGKELRVTRTGELLVRRRRQAWEESFAPVSAVRWTSALWYAAAWTLFGAAYMGAVAYAAIGLRASPGSVLLVLAAGGSLARYLGMTVATAQFLRWTLDAAARVAWLEDYAAGSQEAADQPAPDRIQEGIRLERVSFRYPGTERAVLEDVNLHLPAGAVVALVGENGAGKSTLVKLLCRFYEPSQGRVLVDGIDLSRIPAEQWRARIGGAFQDFMRFEFQVRRTVGLGDQPREQSAPAVAAALARGGATEVVERLPQGLQTQLGGTWSEGVEPSFGQWQKLALARGFMNEEPLLLVLDEPTAALDAETEHALFERFAAQSRAVTRRGRVTLLVSHRFSTVRMADLIIVLDGTRVVETGSHEELMRRAGLYAELYGIQARGYR